jgi:hypothetical protein
MQYTHATYTLRCRDCGQTGQLCVTTHVRSRDWSFTAVGFIGLAVNRYHPAMSVMRCNRCWSSDVRFPLAGHDGAADPEGADAPKRKIAP